MPRPGMIIDCSRVSYDRVIWGRSLLSLLIIIMIHVAFFCRPTPVGPCAFRVLKLKIEDPPPIGSLLARMNVFTYRLQYTRHLLYYDVVLYLGRVFCSVSR